MVFIEWKCTFMLRNGCAASVVQCIFRFLAVPQGKATDRKCFLCVMTFLSCTLARIHAARAALFVCRRKRCGLPSLAASAPFLLFIMCACYLRFLLTAFLAFTFFTPNPVPPFL